MSAISPVTPGELVQVRSRDQDVVVGAVDEVVSHRARVRAADPSALDFRMRSARFGGAFAVDLVSMNGMSFQGGVDPVNYLLGLVLTGGHGTVGARGQRATLVPHDGVLYPLGTDYTVDWHDSSFAVVRVPTVYVAEMAEAQTGLPAADLRFNSMTAVSEPMRDYWARTACFIANQLVAATAGTNDTPLVVDQLFRLGAQAMLSVFANTALTTTHLRGGGAAAPATVRRAVAWIEAHAAEPVTVGQIADAAGLGPRALQEAFRRRLDTTPMAYLRRVRLQRARHDLLAADPTGGATVDGIARRWGFNNLSRFAAEYHLMFGQPPSLTLRT